MTERPGYSFRVPLVMGFHGCDASVAERIFSGQLMHLSPSENSFDWLGSGIYFWEASPARAIQYARLSVGRPSPRQGRINSPAVVGAIIDLGYCLDLLDAQFFRVVRNAYDGVVELVKRVGSPMPRNRSLGSEPAKILRELDCKVINTIHDMRATESLGPFDTVRAAFFEGRPLYKGAGFHDRNHIQICVRNPACIKGYFRPLGDSADAD